MHECHEPETAEGTCPELIRRHLPPAAQRLQGAQAGHARPRLRLAAGRPRREAQHRRRTRKARQGLRLPDWYGANYDALADCLTDLRWNTAPGYVMLISGADELHARDQAAFDTLNEVLSGVIENWQEAKVPFWVFYDMKPNGLAPLPTLAAQ
ncbi:MAG: barstar family protein [Betaproteobacteria bacterium]|nr:barstar family protein [Betaproteobacteria bacterium]